MSFQEISAGQTAQAANLRFPSGLLAPHRHADQEHAESQRPEDEPVPDAAIEAMTEVLLDGRLLVVEGEEDRRREEAGHHQGCPRERHTDDPQDAVGQHPSDALRE